MASDLFSSSPFDLFICVRLRNLGSNRDQVFLQTGPIVIRLPQSHVDVQPTDLFVLCSMGYASSTAESAKA